MHYSYQDGYDSYTDEKGSEFYDTVERLINRFQSLDQQDNNNSRSQQKHYKPTYPPSSSYVNGTGAMQLDSEEDDIITVHPHTLQRSYSLNRDATARQRYGISDRKPAPTPVSPNGGTFITIHDNNTLDRVRHPKSVSSSPFVRGSGVRRTFSGVSRPYFKQDQGGDLNEDNSGNIRLVSHTKYVINNNEIVDTGDVKMDRSRSLNRESEQHSMRRSHSLPRPQSNKGEGYDVKRYQIRSPSPQRKRYYMKTKVDNPKPVEYITKSGPNCFPFSKKSRKNPQFIVSNDNMSYPVLNKRGSYSDQNDSYSGEDSVFDTGYDSALSADIGGKTPRSSLRSRPNDDVAIMSKHSRNMDGNYDGEDIRDYSIGPEPRIRLTKEGYKFIELDVDVSGFRPEDIQIVTQANLLQVIAKGTILKKGSSDEDTRIYRELKRQFSLKEVVNAEYLHGVLTPGGILQIRGPVGVTGNTKKLKRKKVKFHLDN